MAKRSARQHLTTCSLADGLWATKSGGNPSATLSKVWDGGATDPDVLSAPSEYSDLTIGRPYDPARDAAMVARLRTVVGRATGSVTSRDTDANLVAIGGDTTWHGILTGLNAPDGDAGSSDGVNVELIFAVQSVT